MAVMDVEFRSEALKRRTMFKAILPTEFAPEPYPTLYLLHGLKDANSAWLHNTRIRPWAERTGLAVIMPSGENSFYLDVPIPDGCYGDFGEYVGRELVDVTRRMLPLSHERADTYIGGLSMGGYGACRSGLLECDTFGKVIMLSAAVQYFEMPREWSLTKGNLMGELQCFGDLDVAEATDRNPRVLMERVRERNEADGRNHFPDFYVACGTEDILLESNRSIAAALEQAGADVTYEEGPGIHDWFFWDTYIKRALDWLDYRRV